MISSFIKLYYHYEKVFSFIKRFIAGASNEILSLQLQVVKDNANIKKGGPVQVKLVYQYVCKLVITLEPKFEISTSLK